jgi:tryptophan synthase alpha chain
MSRIETVFQELKKRREAALIGYLTAGLPSPEQGSAAAEALIRGGVDILELGIPFSDPIADGPTIQASSNRALSLGVTQNTVFDIVRKIRSKHQTPIALLTYYNLIYKMGIDRFMETCSSSGVNGLVVPDLPIEEADEYRRSAKTHGVDTIFLASPATSVDRLRRIVDATSGFLYLVSLYGVTGARSNVNVSSLDLVKRFKPYTEGKVNLAVGFGISKPEHVKSVIAAGADGAIVGSAFVKLLNEDMPVQKMLKQLQDLATSLKAATVH